MTDRDRILQKTDGGMKVFSHYMEKASKTKTFRNPFRSDSNPSCRLYYHNDRYGGEGRYILKDYGDSQWHGDCFWLVGHLTNLNVRTDFNEILHVIDRELNLFILDTTDHSDINPVIKKQESSVVASSETKPLAFMPKYRHFNRYEIDYWLSYGITLTELEKYHVKALSSCLFERVDGSTYTIYGNRDIPMFAYTFSEGRGIKVYRPGASIGRFLYAGQLPHPYIFGYDQLPKEGHNLFITGGEKDVMTLAVRGYCAVSLNSETAKMPTALLEDLSGRFEHILFLYDSDETGKRESALRVSECRAAEGSCSFHVFTLPLPGTKAQKDVSDYFRCGNTVYDFQALLLSTINTVS